MAGIRDLQNPKDQKRNRALVLLLSPAMLWLAAFMFLPLLIMLYYSFGTMTGVSMSLTTQLTLGNYIRLTQSPLYSKVLYNSVELAVVVVFLCLLLGYPTAYWLSKRSETTKFAFLCLMLVPFWTSVLLRTYAWILMLQDRGAVNFFLQALGIIESPLSMLWSKGAIAVACTQIYLPFMVIPLFGVLEMLDRKLIEAAKNLGASKLRAFWEVTLPLSMPGLVVGTLFVFVPTVGEYLVPSMIGGPNFESAASVVESNFGLTFNWPLGAALAVIVIAIICIAVFGLLKLAPPWKLIQREQ